MSAMLEIVHNLVIFNYVAISLLLGGKLHIFAPPNRTVYGESSPYSTSTSTSTVAVTADHI